MNTAIRNNRGGGTPTSAISAGGNIGGYAADTETWNGTVWSNDTSMSTARQNGAMRAASSTSGIYFGGATATFLTATEEFTGGAKTTKTIATD